jgi:hypothetical protein
MIGVPMKRDYLAYLTGFEKSNMGEKLMNTPVKERWISAESGLSCFTDQITILL